MQTLIQLVFLFLLSLCHAAWGCLILFDAGYPPTLLPLTGSVMPIFSSEWGTRPSQVFLTLPSGLLSYCICTSSQHHSILLTLITFSSQDWVTGWGEWGQKSKMQDIPTCQLWINNLVFNFYPCSKWIVKIPVVVTFVELHCLIHWMTEKGATGVLELPEGRLDFKDRGFETVKIYFLLII